MFSSKHVLVGVTVALVGVAHADAPGDAQARIKTLEATVARLESRVKQLEDINAKNAEALDFLRKVYLQQKQDVAERESRELDPKGTWAVDIAQNIANGQVQGPIGAPVTIVWAYDLADPFSARSRSVIDEIVAENRGKVRVVFKNMIVHPQHATKAHLASCAAGKQRRFLPFWNAFWTKAWEAYVSTRDKTVFEVDNLLAIARDAGLDPVRLRRDMDSKACDDLIKADMAELAKFNVNATPTFFINGEVIQGAMPKENFVQVVKTKLEEAARSGVAPASYYNKVIMTKGEKSARSK